VPGPDSSPDGARHPELDELLLVVAQLTEDRVGVRPVFRGGAADTGEGIDVEGDGDPDEPSSWVTM
jgi:hypothetical protein